MNFRFDKRWSLNRLPLMKTVALAAMMQICTMPFSQGACSSGDCQHVDVTAFGNTTNNTRIAGTGMTLMGKECITGFDGTVRPPIGVPIAIPVNQEVVFDYKTGYVYHEGAKWLVINFGLNFSCGIKGIEINGVRYDLGGTIPPLPNHYTASFVREGCGSKLVFNHDYIEDAVYGEDGLPVGGTTRFWEEPLQFTLKIIGNDANTCSAGKEISPAAPSVTGPIVTGEVPASEFPIGNDLDGVMSGVLTWHGSSPAAAATLNNWQFLSGETSGSTGIFQKTVVGEHKQIRSQNLLLDLVQDSSALILKSYDIVPSALTLGSNGFYDLPTTGLRKTVTYISSGTSELLVQVNEPGLPDHWYEVAKDATTGKQTFIDLTAGTKQADTITQPTEDSRIWLHEEWRIDSSNWVLTASVKNTYEKYTDGDSVSYRLIEEAKDPDGANLVTTHRYRGAQEVVTVNSDGSWSSTTWGSGTSLIGPDGEEDTNFSNASGEIQSIRYSPWLDGELPSSGVPSLSNCVAEVEKSVNESGIYWKVLETYTAGYLSGKVRTRTAFETIDDVDGMKVDYTQTYNSSSSFLTQVVCTLAGRTYKIVKEDGTVRRFSYDRGNYEDGAFTVSSGGAFLLTKEWDDGEVLNVAPASALLTATVTSEDGEVVRRSLHAHDGTDWVAAPMTVETWVHPAELGGSLDIVEHYKDGLLVGNTERVTAHMTIERSAERPETQSLWNAAGELVSLAEIFDEGHSIVTTYERSGQKRTITRSAGDLRQNTVSIYDASNRLISETDASGITRETTYSDGGRTVTITRPGGVTEISKRYRDGQLKSETGTGVLPNYFSYSVSSAGFKSSTTRVGSDSSVRYITKINDWSGRLQQTIRPSPALSGTVTENRVYDSLSGRLVSVDPGNGLAFTRYLYDPLGRVIMSGLDLDSDDVLSLTSSDQIIMRLRSYIFADGEWWDSIVTKNYHTNNSATEFYETIQRYAMAATAAAGGGFTSTSITINPGGETVKNTAEYRLDSHIVIQTVDSSTTVISPDSSTTLKGGRVVEECFYGTSNSKAVSYDALGRIIREIDSRGGIRRMEYDRAGLLVKSINHLGEASTYDYFGSTEAHAGSLKTVIDPKGASTIYHYDSLDRVSSISGNGEYPQDYFYNSYGDLMRLITYRSPTNGDATTWNYDAASGALKEKIFEGGNKISYTYYASGLVHVQTWQRGVFMTYTYNKAGRGLGVNYSDDTPDVTLTLDRLNRPVTIVDSGGTMTRSYDGDLPVSLENTYGSGHAFLPGISVENAWTGGNRTGLIVKRGSTTDLSTAYAYDAITGRLGSVASGTLGHHYSYAPGTSLVSSIDHRDSGTSFAMETRAIDLAGRMTGIRTANSSGTTLTRLGYSYDQAGRRTRATREDGTYWRYGYDSRGEVTSSKKYLPNGTPLAGHQSEYAYDGIGSRTSYKSGGDTSGANLRTATYTSNALNQYVEISDPGTFDVLGRALTASTVTVNSAATARQGERYRAEITSSNSSGPVWETLSVSDGATTKSGHHYVPRSGTLYSYDDDGNLTNDGRWIYTWDAENRLVSMVTTVAAQAVGVPYRKILFNYDAIGRRMRKLVYESSDPEVPPVIDRRFAYDHWNLLAEYECSTGGLILLRNFTWGIDLSGAQHGLGGVGGLLSIKAADDVYVACYDANGNVIGWINADAELVGKQEYDAFGNTLQKEGDIDFSIGFSTKYHDVETNLCYFGHRYYDPQLGRWLSRDAIGENGGLNLFCFSRNDGVNNVDFLGNQVLILQMPGAMAGDKKVEVPEEQKKRLKEFIQKIENMPDDTFEKSEKYFNDKAFTGKRKDYVDMLKREEQSTTKWGIGAKSVDELSKYLENKTIEIFDKADDKGVITIPRQDYDQIVLALHGGANVNGGKVTSSGSATNGWANSDIAKALTDARKGVAPAQILWVQCFRSNAKLEVFKYHPDSGKGFIDWEGGRTAGNLPCPKISFAPYRIEASRSNVDAVWEVDSKGNGTFAVPNSSYEVFDASKF